MSTRRSKRRSRTPVEAAEAAVFPPKSLLGTRERENRTSAYGTKIEKYTTEFNLGTQSRDGSKSQTHQSVIVYGF